MAGLTSRVRAWRDSGTFVEFEGHRIFVRERAGDDQPVLILHGFPSSSYDWREAFARLGSHELLAFDFLGYGLSDKPRDFLYSLHRQADLAEFVARRLAPGPVLLVAHDMGSSVATELLARDLEGRLSFELGGVLLFNGSLVLERASLTAGQKLLRSRLGPVAAQLTTEWSFRNGFAGVFSAAHPLSDDEAADQWALLAHEHGHRILHRLIYYLHERIRFAPRWHGALRDWPGSLQLAWAQLDPIATTNVLAAVLELRPGAPVRHLAGLGHYPQLEDPELTYSAIEAWTCGFDRTGGPTCYAGS